MEEKLVGEVRHADLRERRAQLIGADEAGRQVVVIFCEELAQAGDRLRAVVLREQIQMQRQDVGRLRVDLQRAVRRDVFFLPRGADLLRKVAVEVGICLIFFRGEAALQILPGWA